MKKLISLILVAALLAVGLAACAETDNTGELKVAVVLAGTTGDQSFYDSANEGLQALVAAGGVKGTLFACRNDASKFRSELVTAAENNDIVVAVGWEFWDYLVEVAPLMPKTKFIFVDNGLDGVGDNLLSITYAQNEASFLAGYIAGKLTTTGKIGVVGGEDSDTINDFIVGYEAGAKYADPAVTVLKQYANDYEDPVKGKMMALTLYDAGCDIIFQVASLTGMGVFQAAAEIYESNRTPKLYAIGVDSDQKYINPDVIICSMVKQVGLSIERVVTAYMEDGTWNGGQIWVADMSTGLVDIGYGDAGMTQQISDELKAEVEQIKADIIAGKIKVPTAIT